MIVAAWWPNVKLRLKFLILSSLSLTLLAAALLYAANVAIQGSVRQEIVGRSDAAQTTLAYLAAQHGVAHLDRGG